MSMTPSHRPVDGDVPSLGDLLGGAPQTVVISDRYVHGEVLARDTIAVERRLDAGVGGGRYASDDQPPRRS
jgi:hypothetical protein